MEAAGERLRLMESEERAAAKVQHIAELEDKFEQMQMEQVAGRAVAAAALALRMR